MKTITLQNNWPASWKYSYPYDLLEVYGGTSCRGYAYAYKNRCKNTLKLIQKIASPKARILDVAAGQGNFSLLLAELGYEVTWNDIREELIDYVKLKHEHGAIFFAPGNVFTLSKYDSYFDIILITEVIEHVAHPDIFLQKIAKLVKPGGYVVMTTPNGQYFLNKLPKFSECSNPSKFEEIQFRPNSNDHIFLLHLDEIDTLARQSQLSVVEAKLVSNPLTNGHIKLENLLKILPYKVVNIVEETTNYFPLRIKQKITTCTVILFKRVP